MLDRWLARRTRGEHRIVAVDIHRELLHEATALPRQEGLEGSIEFREGNAEALPFADDTFDVTLSATVMELLDADRMLHELIRVTRPGGRVAVIVRVVDMWSCVNLPLRGELLRDDEHVQARIQRVFIEMGALLSDVIKWAQPVA